MIADDELKHFRLVSVYHRVTTEFPRKGAVRGFLALCQRDDELLIAWRPYPTALSPDGYRVIGAPMPGTEPDPTLFINIPARSIQKVIIQAGPDSSYVLVSSPTTMKQFSVDWSSALAIAQLLGSAVSAADLEVIGTSYLSSDGIVRVFDISVSDGRFLGAAEFKCDAVVEFVEPDLHIMRQFHLPVRPPEPVTMADASTFSELRHAVQQGGAKPEARPLVWPIIFQILRFGEEVDRETLALRVEEYQLIQAQWSTLAPFQLKYRPLVHNAFTTIRVDVRRTHPPHHLAGWADWQGLLTRVLRTFVLWNMDVRYTQGLNDLAAVFAAVFVPAIGTLYTAEEAEALSFWCFASFVEKIGSGLLAPDLMATQNRELGQVLAIVERAHPAAAQWLRTNDLGDLGFLIGSFILAYGRSFAFEGVCRLWEALGTTADGGGFLRYFSSALLIMSLPSLVKLPNASMGKIVAVLDDLLSRQDIQKVIAVALEMQANVRSSSSGTRVAVGVQSSDAKMPLPASGWGVATQFQEAHDANGLFW